jgi:hypothetical protein
MYAGSLMNLVTKSKSDIWLTELAVQLLGILKGACTALALELKINKAAVIIINFFIFSSDLFFFGHLIYMHRACQLAKSLKLKKNFGLNLVF